ncbi:NUDIX domain-containing protein [Streptomyces sp. NPDC048258]|uniref:NUDIX domain-containing protein n=1 Tax=Streptomyces sp. NPDC048258 TaxID=3365527 RepID=UPI003715B142
MSEGAEFRAEVGYSEVLCSDWITLRKYTLNVISRNGGRRRLERLTAGRGDRVSVLLYCRSRHTLLLTGQFRVPVLLDGDPGGTLIEAPGGLLDGQDAGEVAGREAEEETGYRVSGLLHLLTTYMSPQLSDEKMHLFFGEYSAAGKVSDGGGLASEGEENEVLEISADAGLDTLMRQPVVDGKTMLLFLMAHRLGLIPESGGCISSKENGD